MRWTIQPHPDGDRIVAAAETVGVLRPFSPGVAADVTLHPLLAGVAAHVALVITAPHAQATEGETEFQPSWMPRSRDLFGAFVAELEAAAPDRPLWVWPSAGHVISDVPSLLSFLRAHPRWRFVLDPLAMLTASMAARTEDHLVRIFESLADHDAATALVLPARPSVLVDRLASKHWPAGRPVIAGAERAPDA
jgi:hypothetical protein